MVEVTDLWSAIVTQHVRSLSVCDSLVSSIVQATKTLRTTLDCGGKIILCGDGGSFGRAQQFTADLVARHKRNRPALAAFCLGCNASVVTAIVDELGAEHVFARELLSVYRPLDTLVAFCASGRNPIVLNALSQATQCELTTIAITGMEGMAAQVTQEIRVPVGDTACIHDIHQLIVHTLCEGLDA